LIKILFPINKSVPAIYKHYPEFLNILSDNLSKIGIDITYMLFSKHLKEDVKSSVLISSNSYSGKANPVSAFESKYGISLREYIHTDLMQTSKFIVNKRHRNWYIPEHEYVGNDSYANIMEGIENEFNQIKYDFVITDQTTDYEQSFIRSLCEKRDIPFIRYIPNFMNRGLFISYGKSGNGRILKLPINQYDLENSQTFVNDFRSGARSNIYNMNENNLTIFNPNPKESIWKKLFKKKYQEYRFLVELKIKDLVIKKIESRLKKNYYDELVEDDKYIYYGLHLTTESHVSLHSYPFMNQINVIETISRALPYGYKLYVKPHPWWEHTISLGTIRQLKRIPFVRLINPHYPIKTIISKSSGLVTLNATTGVEALILGKPVIALSEVNSYVSFHPCAQRCSNMYQLPRMIRHMIDSEVKIDDTIDYIAKMFSISSDIRMEGDRFISEADARSKAKKFASCIRLIVENYSTQISL
jgi:hypothetical protein